MAEPVFETDDGSLHKKLCGSKDKNIRLISELTGAVLIPRGSDIIVKADAAVSDLVMGLLHLLSDLIVRRDDRYEPDDFEIKYIAAALARGVKITADDILKLKVVLPDSSKIVVPKTLNQADYLHSIFTRPLTFGVGPAGTGKTFLAVVAGLYLLLTGKTERIILSRPAVEAGENLGFLPGDLIQKINPYLRPLYDALFELQPVEKISRFIEKGIIEIAPLAYMRGRTLNNSFIILDEAQNTLKSQMKMFLTRLGNNSRFVISGDETQIDIDKPKDSGLFHAMKILKNINDIRFIRFTRDDISRHPLVEKIVEAYEREGAE